MGIYPSMVDSWALILKKPRLVYIYVLTKVW